MILFEICNRNEAHPLYQAFEAANGARQYDFLASVIEANRQSGRPFLSSHIIKALNFQAITCLHTNAGEYRPCQVYVGTGPDRYVPPEHYVVQALMDDMVNSVNRAWETGDPIVLASYVLWRMNHIHPFINGNGRTARAACYFVLCLKLGGLLGGAPILPELIRQNRGEYVEVLKRVDASYNAGNLDLAPLAALLAKLLEIQQAGVPAQANAGAADPGAGAPAGPPLALPPPDPQAP